MKLCPYCAESIQDAAVKCRYCGEWLDPDKRPGWSGAGIDSARSTTEPLAEPASATTRTKGLVASEPALPSGWVKPGAASAQKPRDGNAGWAAPPWLARGVPSGSPEAPSAPVHVPEATAAAITPDRRQLDEIAARMERIRAEAASVRNALRQRAPNDAAAKPIASQGEWHSPAANAAGWQGGAESRHDRPGAHVPHAAHVAQAPPNAAAAQHAAAPRAAAPAPAAVRGAPAPSDKLAHDFLGESLEGEEVSGVSIFAGMASARRPLPWPAILIASAIVVGAGLVVFADRLFAPPTDAAEVREQANTVRNGSIVAPRGSQSERAPQREQGTHVNPGLARPVRTDASQHVDAQAMANHTDASRTAAPSPTVEANTVAPAATQAAPPMPTDQSAADVPAAARPKTRGVELPAALQTQLVQARAAYEKRKLAEAKALLDAILQQAPSSAAALLLRAQVELEGGEFERSLASATRCIEIDPGQSDCWLTLGVLQQNRKQNDAAIAAYKEYLALAPRGNYARDVRTQLQRLAP